MAMKRPTKRECTVEEFMDGGGDVALHLLEAASEFAENNNIFKEKSFISL